MTAGITSRLAEFALGTASEDVPSAVIERSKEMMLNAAGIGLAGVREPEGPTIVEFVRERGGNPSCSVIGSDVRTTPEYAALANGTLVHVLDFDENIERRSNHPSNVMFPTVMAIGEFMGSSGRDVVAAFAIGCEVSTKLGAAGDLDEQFPRLPTYGFTAQAVTGTFGATAAAGRLLGLTRDELENAFGLACSQAAGLLVNHGTSSKPVQAGTSAMKGILCATLAQRGLTGARDGIEAERGFLEAFRRDRGVDEDEFVSRLGNPYDVIDPGVRLKVYPCGSYTHVSLEAMLHLIREHDIQATDVRRDRGCGSAAVGDDGSGDPAPGNRDRREVQHGVRDGGGAGLRGAADRSFHRRGGQGSGAQLAPRPRDGRHHRAPDGTSDASQSRHDHAGRRTCRVAPRRVREGPPEQSR